MSSPVPPSLFDLDRAPVAMLRTDERHHVTWANHEALRMLGPEVLERPLLDQVDAVDLPLATAFAATDEGRAVLWMQLASGRGRCELRGRRDADGSRTVVLLDAPHEQPRELWFDAQRDLVLVVQGPSFEVVGGNTAAVEWFGRGSSGWSFTDVVSGPRRAASIQRLYLALERPNAFELEVQGGQGDTLEVELVASQQADERDRWANRWLLSLRDLRARSEVAAARERELTSAHRRTSQEAMTRVAGAAGVLLQGLVGDLVGYLAGTSSRVQVEGALEQAGALAQGLTRLGAVQPAAERSFDLRDEVRAATVQLARETAQGIQVLGSVGDEPVAMVGDAAAWRAAIVAVGHAAASRLSGEGRIELVMWRVRQAYWLEVRDNGPAALSPEELERLFEPFGHAGAGIGLALVEATARAHGASVAARSQPGIGTTVTFKGTVLEGGRTLLPRLRLLVVDDDPSVRRGLYRLLNRHHHIVEADGGPSALRHLAGESFDLVICDVHMPGTSGLEVCAEARHLQPTAMLVLMTGYLEREHLERALSAADAVLEKPFSYGTFAGIANELLRKRRAAG